MENQLAGNLRLLTGKENEPIVTGYRLAKEQYEHLVSRMTDPESVMPRLARFVPATRSKRHTWDQANGVHSLRILIDI